MACPASAPTRSAVPCMRPGIAGRKGGAGALPAWSCASASTPASSPSPIRMPRQKGADRASLHAWCLSRPDSLVRGRSGSVPGGDAAGQQLAAARPARDRPHEYVRGGTCKILTLFHPASGQGHLQSVGSCTNLVLHGWLKQRLEVILGTLPPPAASADAVAIRAAWEVWQAGLAERFTLPTELPPLR